MSSTNISIQQLNTASTTIVMIISIINFVFGIIGLTLNIFIFTRSSFRQQPCSFYFLSSTYVNFFVILIIIPVRILTNIYNIDMTDYNLPICKIQSYSFYVARTISCWLIALATIDRYLHSSSNALLRRKSSVKIAKIATGIIMLLIFVLYSHMIVYFNISYTYDQFGGVVTQCNAQQGTYRIFFGLWYMIFYSLAPSSFMLLFGVLTIKNLRQRQRITPTTVENNHNTKRTNFQLLRMLAAQVLVIIISTLPFSTYRLYSALTYNVHKTTLRLAQESLIAQIVFAMTYFAHSSSFYMYTLSGTMFQNELKKIIRSYWSFNRNRIQTSAVINTQSISNTRVNQRNTGYMTSTV